MDNWIIKENSSNYPSNSEAFISYQNIKLNTNSFNSSVLNNLNISLITGAVEELKVTINWKEIFRYWTEIRAKYHVETEEDDDFSDIESLENSLIKIKGLILDLDLDSNGSSKVSKVSNCYRNESVINNSNVDLIKDFLNHIIGQFKLEIDEIKIFLNKNLVIKISKVIILPESNGIRRITIPEDIAWEILDLNGTSGKILKGTEILIMRSIERNLIIKIKIPGIETESNDLNSLIKLVNSFKFESRTKDNTTDTNVNIIIDSFKLSISPLTIFLHDIWIDNTGSFVIGHFSLKLRGYSTIMSPIQTHVVKGDFKRYQLMVEEEIIIRLRDIKQIEEIRDLLNYEKNENTTSNNDIKYQVSMRSVVLVLDDISSKIYGMTIVNNFVSIDKISINYHLSNLIISDVKYNMRSNIVSSPKVSPFSELKRFIENDEILSIEKESILYASFKGLINNLKIYSLTGSIELDALMYFTTLIPTDTSNNSPRDLFSVMGTFDKISVSLNLSCDTIYLADLSSISFLKADGFVDLRAHLVDLQRNNQILMHSTDLSVVKIDDEIVVGNIENLNLIIPFNLHEILSDDMKRLKLSSKNETSKNSDFQFSLKNSKMKLEAPDNLKEPVESELIIKEINCKLDVLYVDEAILRLNKDIILNSGLIKIKYDSKSIEVTNHYSDINLDRSSYQYLIKFTSFWSEIYSPIIEEIKPEAVFHDESSFIEEESEGISGILMQFEGEGNEDIELELELSVSDTEEVCSEFLSEEAGYTHVTTSATGDNLIQLLKDVDDEFFKSKEKEVDNDYFMKILNFGIKINLVLSDSSKSNLTISLDGIDGTISVEKISLKLREGSIHKNIKTILHRWPRGPDVTCKYSIEDVNFISLKAEKVGIKNDAGIDEFNLIISICPLRLFLDQKSLNEITTFFTDEQVKMKSNDKLTGFIFFNKVNISQLALKIDFNPNSTSSTAPIPLQGAEMILPRVELRGIKGFEGLGPAAFSAWLPELRGKKLTGVLTTGLVPVRTFVNLGGGVAELILLPWQLGPEQSAAQTVAEIRKNGKRIGLETLKLTASLANRTSKLLSIEQSPTANYPRDFQSGVQQAVQLIIALPTRLSQSNKGALRAVPLIVLDSAATATGALAKTLQGIQAEFDKEIDYERKIKRK